MIHPNSYSGKNQPYRKSVIQTDRLTVSLPVSQSVNKIKIIQPLLQTKKQLWESFGEFPKRQFL
jgi:hypothetical protein